MFHVRVRNSSEVRLYRLTRKKKEVGAGWPWVQLETPERALMFKNLAERKGVLPEWYLRAAVGLPNKPRALRNPDQTEIGL